MSAFRIVGMFLMTILTSFYFFPFEFAILPGVNTKMAMAGFGLVLLGFMLVRKKEPLINRDIFLLSLLAGGVSLIGWISVTYNGTPDFAYANYIISMWVWLSAAYTVIICMRKVHGMVSIFLLVSYLSVVCVLQCILALLIDSVPSIRSIAIIVMGPQDWIESVNRLYGIGAALDTAGARFSLVLVLIAYSSVIIEKTDLRKWLPLYFIAFFIIGIVGNMIARTTTVGVILALVYWLYISKIYKFSISGIHKRLWIWGIILFIIVIVITSYFYCTDISFEKKIRFAFEGFFSLVEDGEWNVSSNDRLQDMYILPESWKTWIIGDGYFSNPKNIDPYFIGKEIKGYYMGTDVGYLRFIFYFGIFGMLGMCMILYKAASSCMLKFPHYKMMFLLLLIVNYLVWLKVSTDMFLVFALFLMINEEEEKVYQLQIVLKE